jgi:HEPN domain-containing protein
MENSRRDAREWLDKARGDLHDAHVLMANPMLGGSPRTGSVCFHAQQCVEKGLKAVAVSLGAQFRKTHILLDVADVIRAHSGEVPFSPEELASLDPWAVVGRYPGTDEPSDEIAERALRLAERIYAWAKGAVG